MESPASGRGVRPFVIMAKPVGSACNMRCSYCYYLHTPCSSPEGRMSPETLELMIRDYFRAAPGPVVSFVWHGGEPTLAGLDFYRTAVELQRRYLPAGWKCWNNLQTNGLLLDDAWCRFLRDERFDVGVSLDGTASVHDAFRPDAAGRKTFDRVAESIRRLQAHGIQPDLLCTVNSETVKNGVAVYQTLRDFGTGWMQFIPILRRDESGALTPDSVSSAAYGEFLKEIFSQWIFHDLDRTEVQFFSEIALVLSGGKPNLCWMQEECGHVPVVEKEGSVFACDHFVRPAYRIGALSSEGLRDLMTGPAQRLFGRRKSEDLSARCRACPWLSLCRGGCPKDRFLPSSGEGDSPYYALCEGLRAFFAYAVPLLKEAMRLSSRGIDRREIMRLLILSERDRFRSVSRNDPCPCGSGKKFKQFCHRLCP